MLGSFPLPFEPCMPTYATGERDGRERMRPKAKGILLTIIF